MKDTCFYCCDDRELLFNDIYAAAKSYTIDISPYFKKCSICAKKESLKDTLLLVGVDDDNQFTRSVIAIQKDLLLQLLQVFQVLDIGLFEVAFDNDFVPVAQSVIDQLLRVVPSK